jgi:uncharacterized delta-60 repeat protein
MWPTLNSLCRTLSGKAPSRPAPRRRPAIRRPSSRPRLEALEDRTTPSGGLLDPTFGTGGIVNLPNATDYAASAVAVQPDGKVVVAGQTNRTTGTGQADSITVQRLNRDGSLDTTFNKTGSLTIQTGKSDWPKSVALQPDGEILVGGGATSNNGSQEFLVARLNANGTLDTTFASKGLWVSASPYGEVEKLAVLTDPAHPSTVTGIVAAAQGSANGTRCLEAIKLTPAGAPDRTFGAGGFAVFANLNLANQVVRTASVAVDRLSGEIYLAGPVSVPTANNTGCLAALTPAGALDPAFGGGAGYVLADPTGSHEIEFYDVAVQTLTVNGQAVSRVLVAGLDAPPATHFSGVVYGYTPAGTLDASFGSGGTFSIPGLGTGVNLLFSSLALEADGSIVVGGSQRYTATDGTYPSEMVVGHLTAAGAADTSFGPDGTGFTVVPDGLDSKVLGVAIDPLDGGILACGVSDSTRQSPAQAAVARFTAP